MSASPFISYCEVIEYLRVGKGVNAPCSNVKFTNEINVYSLVQKMVWVSIARFPPPITISHIIMHNLGMVDLRDSSILGVKALCITLAKQLTEIGVVDEHVAFN